MEKRAKRRRKDARAEAPPASLVVLKPPSKAFFERLSPPSKMSPPEAIAATREQVVGEIRDFALNWGKTVEDAMGLPKKLFRMASPGMLAFCSDENAPFGNVIETVRRGSLAGPVGGYGIIVHSTVSTSSITLFDMERRIIVHEDLGCLHDRQPQADWAPFAAAISSASALARRVSGDSVVTCDRGRLKVVKRNK